jgi:hypothetical protein
MPHDEVITELWRIKDEIAAECNYDIHALAKALREDEKKHPRDLLTPTAAISHPEAHALRQ